MEHKAGYGGTGEQLAHMQRSQAHAHRKGGWSIQWWTNACRLADLALVQWCDTGVVQD